MKSGKWGIKALSIMLALLFSFILPALIVPALEQAYDLSEFHLDLLRSLFAAIPTFLGLLLVYLYHNSDTMYVFVNRTWLWVSNSTVSWSLSAEYHGSLKPQTIEKIYREILDRYDDAETLKSGPLEKLVNLPRTIGGVIRLKFLESADSDELDYDPTGLLVRVFDLNIPFRKSEKAIEALDLFLVSVVEKDLVKTKSRYTFRINFDATNPYYGLFLQEQRVPFRDIESFNCAFVDRRGQEDGYVDIGKRKLVLTTHSAADFRRLSRRYVSLALPDFNSV